MSNHQLPLPSELYEALELLENAGFEAWVVGGIRELLLRREGRDWSISTDALPHQIKTVFQNYQQDLSAEKLGIVGICFQGLSLEVNTYRKEGEAKCGNVRFSKNLFDDLKRRDFTVNAVAYHPEHGFRDFFCGKRDLKKRWIRAIGDADARFNQDPIRILRAMRFSAILGFDMEEKTKSAIHRNKELLLTLAPERIVPEFTRMLCGRNIRYVLTEFSDVIGVLIPEILPAVGFSQRSPFHQYDVWQHSVHAVAYSDPVPEIRLTLFFHDLSKPGCLTVDETGRGHFYSHPKKSAALAKEVMARMKFAQKEIDLITLLVYYHDSHPSTETDVKQLIAGVGEENFFRLLRVMEADTLAHSKWTVKKRLAQIQRLKDMGEKLLASGVCCSLKGLAVSAEDLEAKGVSGQRIPQLLKIALQNVILGRWENSKEAILGELAKNNW